MERIVGIALTRYLATYIKDFSAQKFQNWALNDLEFNEEVIQNLVGIPPQLRVKKVTCNQIYTKIPWKKLGHDPIVFVADKIYIELEEPEEIKPAPKKVPKSLQPKKKAPGFTDRILDNIKFEVHELTFKVITLGKHRKDKERSKPPALFLHVKDILIQSTNAKWEAVDLKEVHKVNHNNQVLIFKEIHLGQVSLSLHNDDNRVPMAVLDKIPIRVRIKTKKEYFGGPLVDFQIDVDLLSDIALKLDPTQYNDLQKAIYGTLNCLSRQPKQAPVDTAPKAEENGNTANTTTNSIRDDISETSEADVSEHETHQPQAQQQAGVWGRLTNRLWSYYSTKNQPEPIPATPAVESVAEPDSNSDSDAEYQDAESGSEEDLPDEEATVADDEDIRYTSYNIHIHKGTLELFERLNRDASAENKDAPNKGLCSLRFDGLKCSFFPKMRGDYQDQGQWITQSEAHIKINSYSLTVLDPGPSRHPDYLQLIKFDTGSHSNTHENMGGLHTEVKVKAPMLNLNFIKRHIPTTIRRPEVTIFSRELELSFNNCAIIFDKEIWERTYNFFLSGRKGKQLQRTLEQGMENMLQVALRDYVKFKIESKNPTIILPPYAGHKGPPHIASQVMRLNVGYVSMSNNDPTYPTPEAFTGGLFVLPAPHFPAAPYDFSSHIGQEKLVSAQKFQVETTNLSVDLQATPESRIERVLQPFNLVVNISLNDYLHSPKFTPNFELFVQVSRVNFAINPAQYKYFTSVFSERLSWSPGALLNENKALEHQSDELNNTNAIEPIPASPVQEESPFLSCFKVKIDRGLIQLNEVVPNSDPKSHDLHYSTLAEIEFQNIAVILESQATKNAIKVQLDTFNIQCPQHIKSPFPMLLSPLNTAQNSRTPMLVVRYESVKLKPGDKPLAADVKAKINHVQICLIYSTLSKLQSFLTSDDLKITVDTEKFKQFLSKYSNVENVAMNWSVDFTASEALVVESPDTPECAPAILHHVSISKFGIDDLNVKYNFSGRLAFASIMWEQTHFHREDISQPCNVALEYLSTRENTQDDGTNHVTMTIDDLTASLSRTQFIFMQTIVDNLFTDIRDVSTKRDEGKIIKIDTRKRLRARYQINVRASHLTLRQGKKNLALVRIDRFSYTYENWTHKFRTLIEGDALVIEDLSAERTQFKTLVQPRHNTSSASSEELNDNEADTEDEDDGAGVLINEPNNNNHQPPVQKKKRKKRRLPRQLRMIIDPTRADEEDHSGVELTESPGTMRQGLTTSSLEQIKRIADKADRDELGDKDRKLHRLNACGSIANERAALFRLCFESKNKEFIAARINEGLSIDHLHDEEPQSDREDEDDGAWSTSWVIDIAQLEVVYVPETFGQLKEFFSLVGEHKNLRRQYQKIQAEILSLYQKEDYSNVFKETQQEMIKRASQRVDMSGPGPVNAVDSVPKSEAQQLRLKINISQPVVLLPEKLTESITSVLEVTLRAVQIGNNTANKTQITVQHATVRLKRIQTLAIDQSSRVLQSLDVLKPLTCEVNIYSRPNFVHIETIIDTFAGVISLQKYQTSIGIVQQYVEQFMKSLQSDPNSSIEPANKGPFVDKVIELSVRSVNLTIVSDYVAELELFYLYFKGVDVTANMYEEFTEVNMSAKFEAMVNNLSFMMPEQFIDDMHFAVKARLSNKITELDDAEPVSDYESASSAQLDYLTIDNGAGVLIDEEVSESPHMSSRPSFNGSLHDTERRTKKQSRLSLEVVVLDKVVVRVTKELLRHLIEIYQLYLNHRSDDHSHFQYILSNKTESQALYHQAKTADIKVLAPGEEASFNFTNPYLPKLLSIKLNGWQQTNKALAVDEPSSSVMTIQQENNPQLTRDIIVNVKPKGLKRYVELIASHQVHNETDLCLELMTWWSDKNLPTQTYTIEPSKSVPICCSQLWEMQFAVRCNDNIDWDFSDNFVMPSIRRFRDRDVTQKLTITSVDQSTKRVLFMTYISDTTNPNLVRINFSAPFIIQNLSVFPLDCDFPHNRRFDMTIPANSQQAFYFDPAQPNQTVAFKLEGYDRYSRPIPVHYLQRTTVENKRDVHRDQDKSLVYLNVFNQHRLASREARTMYVNTKYLLINETDLPLFVRQRGTREEVAILPHTKAPFSWLKFGARQLQVKVADTAWSRAINISQPSVNRINITIKDIHLSYDLMMEVKQLDAFSRVVIWRSRLHFTNQTNRDLVIRFNSGTEGARTNTLLLKKNSLVDSAIAPAGLELSVSQQQPSRDNGPALSYEEWDYVPFKIDKVGRFTKKINNLTSYKQYFIADIAVEKDEKGVYICFTENVTPPYLIYNNTPFNLKLRPALFNAPALNMNGVQDEEHEHEYKNDKVPLLGPPSSGGHRRSRSEGGTSPALNAGPDGLLNPAPLIVVEPRGSAEWYDDGLTQHDKSAEEAAQERKKKKKRQRRGSSLLNTLMFQAALELANEGSALTPRSRANGSGHTSDAGGEDSLLLDDESFSDIEHESGNNTNVFQPGHSRNNSSGSIKRGTTLARSGEVINITPSSSLRRSRQVPQPGQYSTPPARRSTPAKHERTLSSSALVPQLNLRQSVQTRRSQIDKYTSLLTERGNQWSQPFNIERLGEFVVQFDELDDSTAAPLSERSTASSKISMGNHRHAEDEDKHEHGQSLLLSVITRGNTKILTFSLPSRKEDGSVAPLNTATEVLRVNLRVPQFDICIMDQSSTQEALYTTITEINMELSKMSSYQYYVYLTVHELEIDTMFKTAEYPVLFTTDRRTLHSIKPNLLEALVEWSVRDKHTIVQYLGARLLPLFLQLDGDALDAIMQLKGYLNPKADNVAEDDEQARMKAMLQNYNVTNMNLDHFLTQAANNNAIYVDKIDIFPLDITISIGANNYYLPVISEARLSLPSFQRSSLYHTMASLMQFIASSYFKFVWTELYQIIGNMDVIASPIQNARKLFMGFKDFFLMPVESLVLDDTPGAFLFGAARGTRSLLLNLADFVFTTLMKLINAISWLVHWGTLDDQYLDIKARVNRRHPVDALDGLIQGGTELLRGLWGAASSVCLVSYRGAQEEGVTGFFQGLGAGTLGVVLKPIGGVLDFTSKIFEGVLQSLGRGNLMLTRSHQQRKPLTGPQANEEEVIDRWLKDNNEKLFAQDRVKVINHYGRVSDRVLLLTLKSMYILSVPKLTRPEYMPKSIPTNDILEVIVPTTPETTFIVHSKVPLYGQTKFLIIAPDRDLFINKLTLFFNVPAKPQNFEESP